MKPFNLEEAKAGKPVQTRDGRPVRIICWDRKHDQLYLVGLLCYKKHREHCVYYSQDGKAMGPSHLDLVMAPVERTVYVVVWKGKYSGSLMSNVYDSEAEANADIDRMVNVLIVGKPTPVKITE